ncbi:hypothetical protein CWI42_090030 [Ordospora colligata]|uniref:Uncharacterized protein n=1 Tax=Ordospora colligata OC4 TaxID=1354746 RepID=A0A0B2UJC1_9MICR|nr:uncharacterized protein M896_090030 [Ordospora colligata OC4]KHN69080.1 hypothetical protein M896_090030 [Ordospora colligata OC4]TBU14535.1 hypothetical protein CWI41_090030 [Ordospora colligata]TBU14729.1 hypothetical protein CWI40_090040 [Ordospora colligata]TBU18163.1 hypothetical protein CWI42_090030 [Ordospora colligata]
MGRVFKKFRLQKAKERRVKNDKPRVGKLQEIISHKKEHDDVEKIFYCLNVSGRRRMAYRRILDLDEIELQKNIFIVSEKILDVVVNFDPIDKLFYPAFKRILGLKNSYAIHGLLIDYFIASILSSVKHQEFGMFLLKQVPQLLFNNKGRITDSLPNGELKSKIESLKGKVKCPVIKFDQKYTLLKENIILD